MITKKELTGVKVKKVLNINSACLGFHNKNNSGGNFALIVRSEKEFNPDKDFEIYGHYDTEGNLKDLTIMSIRNAFSSIKINLEEVDFDGLMEILKNKLEVGFN